MTMTTTTTTTISVSILTLYGLVAVGAALGAVVGAVLTARRSCDEDDQDDGECAEDLYDNMPDGDCDTQLPRSLLAQQDGGGRSPWVAREVEIAENIRDEQLSRHRLYFGDDGMRRLREAKVCVVGVGGVGSHTAHMLARSGVGHLRLVDFDQVSLSSLNRHATATLDDVGIPKVTALARHLRKICPDARYLRLEERVQMFTGDSEKDDDLLELNTSDSQEWSVMIDAIDDVPTKARLIQHCISRGIRCISCMGAGGKSDFTRLHVSDLRNASRDPLASKLRQSLRRLGSENLDSYLDNVTQLAVVWSSEKLVVKLAEMTPQQKEQGIQNFGALDNMRIRVLPVLGTLPAIMGQGCAALAITELGNKTFNPVAGERVGRNVRNRMYQHLRRRELRIRDLLEIAESRHAQRQPQQQQDQHPNSAASTEANDQTKDNANTIKLADGTALEVPPYDETTPRRVLKETTWVGPLQMDGSDDVEYLLAEVWRNRCAVTGDRLGTVLEFVRWDMSRPSDCTNLVLLGVRALQKFDAALCLEEVVATDDVTVLLGDGRDSVPPEIRRCIEERLETCRIDSNA